MNMAVAQQNLEKLLSLDDEGGMLLFLQESIGGNASHHGERNCFALNFHYGPSTGQIARFTNALPPHDLNRGHFRFVLDYRCNPWSTNPPVTCITGGSYRDTVHRPLEREAIHTLNATLILYNHDVKERSHSARVSDDPSTGIPR